MNKISYMAVFSVMAIIAGMGIASTAYAEVLFSSGNSPAVTDVVVNSDGTVTLNLVSQLTLDRVQVMGVSQTLTAEDIIANDTIFEDVTSLNIDVTRNAFPIGTFECVFVEETFAGEETHKLVC